MTISILGCGWLGMPMGAELAKDGHVVKGSYRKAESEATLMDLGIIPVKCTLEPDFIGDRSIFEADALVISIPPRLKSMGETFHLEQVRSIAEKIKASKSIKNIVFVSSTSVYGKEPGTYTENMADTEHVLFKAEQILIDFCEKNKISCQVLRMGGLMGYDREPCKYLNAETSDLASCINYVFRDDAISAIKKLIFEKNKSGVFNISSPIHPTRGEILENRCGVKIETMLAEKPSKIIDSQLFIEQYAFTYAYPDPIHYPKA
jgi:nucleoside-diphosphate-sugar epimerase